MTVTEPTPQATADPTVDAAGPEDEATAADDELVADELLVEEISIDGMCGVY